MRNGLMNSEIELGNFGEYLLKSRVVLEKHVVKDLRNPATSPLDLMQKAG